MVRGGGVLSTWRHEKLPAGAPLGFSLGVGVVIKCRTGHLLERNFSNHKGLLHNLFVPEFSGGGGIPWPQRRQAPARDMGPLENFDSITLSERDKGTLRFSTFSLSTSSPPTPPPELS